MRKRKNQQPAAGRINLFLGEQRKAAFKLACEKRGRGMTAAILDWMDRFILATPGVPHDFIMPPVDPDPPPIPTKPRRTPRPKPAR